MVVVWEGEEMRLDVQKCTTYGSVNPMRISIANERRNAHARYDAVTELTRFSITAVRISFLFSHLSAQKISQHRSSLTGSTAF